MQKKIIALAIAGLMSGAAFAQSNVTISGRLDANVVRWSGNGERLTDVGESGVTTSRLTFKATEDLGGGLKSGVVYESKLTPGTSAGNGMGDRAAYVFLEGTNWGSIQLGMQSSPTDAWIPGYDYAGNFTGRVVFGDAKGDISTNKQDAFAYYSPKFSGLQFAFYHDFDQATVTGTRANNTQLAAQYASGPLSAMLAYTTQGQTGGTKKQTDFAASYNFGVFKLMGTYETNKNASAIGEKNKLWMLGAVVPVGKGNIHVGYTKDDVQTANADNKFWSLAYTYGFSKRTTAYVGYGRFATDSASTDRPSAAFTAVAGSDYNAVVGGLIHSF